jgi:phosphatidylinositol alpha-1,6-mannosyltransferase
MAARDRAVTRPCLAAITLDREGGGVATVSRLFRQAFRDRWGEGSSLVTLVDDGKATTSLEASTFARIRFGTRLASRQILGQCPWVFYTHLSVARVQGFVPPPVRQPYGVFLHGVEAWQRLAASQRRVLTGAALRIANSAFTARRVAEAHPRIGPIAHCPLALPPRDRDAGDTPADLPPMGTHAVVLVARMLASEHYKGHDELLDAWTGVRARVPDARLVFVGDGDDVPRLKGRSAALGIGDSVIFTGFVSESQLHAVYERAAVFAMPSRGEGFGMVYIEAMSHRLPCIGSIHDAAPEIIEDGVTGFLIEQSDIAALTDRIVRLLTDEARRAEMGENGLRRVERRFSYSQFAQTAMSLVESSLGAPAAASLLQGSRS